MTHPATLRSTLYHLLGVLNLIKLTYLDQCRIWGLTPGYNFYKAPGGPVAL